MRRVDGGEGPKSHDHAPSPTFAAASPGPTCPCIPAAMSVLLVAPADGAPGVPGVQLHRRCARLDLILRHIPAA